MTETAERHTICFSDCEVEVILGMDGEAEVNLRGSGKITSFSWENWEEVVRFAAAAKDMSSGMNDEVTGG